MTQGTCRICGCTDEHPCAIAAPIGPDALTVVTCMWVDVDETVCSNVRCMEAAGLVEDRALLEAAQRPRIILP